MDDIETFINILERIFSRNTRTVYVSSEEYRIIFNYFVCIAKKIVTNYRLDDCVKEEQCEDAAGKLFEELSNPDSSLMKNIREIFLINTNNEFRIKNDCYRTFIKYLETCMLSCLKACADSESKERMNFKCSVKYYLKKLVTKNKIYSFNNKYYSANNTPDGKGNKLDKKGIEIKYKKIFVNKRVSYKFLLENDIYNLLIAKNNYNYYYGLNEIANSLYESNNIISLSEGYEEENSVEDNNLKDYYIKEQIEKEEKEKTDDLLELFPDISLSDYLIWIANKKHVDKLTDKQNQIANECFIAKLASYILENPNLLLIRSILPEHIKLLGIVKVVENNNVCFRFSENDKITETEKFQNFLNVVLYNNLSNLESEKTVKRTTSNTRHNDFDNEFGKYLREKIENEFKECISVSFDFKILKEYIDSELFDELVSFYYKVVDKGE